MLEARFAGFGASGRNGGWLSGLVPGDRARLAQQYGRQRVVAWQRALNDAVDEVIDVTAREGIDAGVVKGGTLEIARNPAQAARLAAAFDEELRWGDDDVALLTGDEAAQRIRFADMISAYHTPHCARIQPARLARGLADVVERLGVDIYEQTTVTGIAAGRADTAHGTVRARHRAARHRGVHREDADAAAAVAADEQFDDRHRADSRADRGTRSAGRAAKRAGDTAHGFFYAQRTVDDRIAIGGRSVPYRYASRTDVDGRVPARTIGRLTEVLHAILPQIRDVPIAHGWCGVLAVPRDWSAGVALDRSTGLGWAGGYVGHGVTAANLAGRTLADLVLRHDTDRTALPWVGHRARDWEPEPLRWLGVRGLYTAYQLADRHEARGRATTSPIAALADRIAGRPH